MTVFTYRNNAVKQYKVHRYHFSDTSGNIWNDAGGII